MTIRISITSIDQTRAATWFADNRVIIAAPARIVTHASTRAEFDALCVAHGIEPMQGGTQKRKQPLLIEDES